MCKVAWIREGDLLFTSLREACRKKWRYDYTGLYEDNVIGEKVSSYFNLKSSL
jgi:hypothetical protein